MVKKNVYNWDKVKEQAKINIEFALDTVDDFFGDAELARKDNCQQERLIAFQEVLRVIMPTALLIQSSKEQEPTK